jgi:hypothetical protein
MKGRKILFGIAALVCAAMVVLAGLAACSKKDSGAAASGESSGGGSSGGSSAKAAASALKGAAPASDFTYDLSEDGKGVVINKYTGNGGKLVIPAEIEGLPVVELGMLAFFGEYNSKYGPGYNITSVVIPASVKKIGDGCFNKIEKLTSVTFLGSDVTIGGRVFHDCINLSELNLPEGENILKPTEGDWSSKLAFEGCKKLPLAMRAKLKSWGFDEP